MDTKDKDDGILGDGLAESARKKLSMRQKQLNEILGESTEIVANKTTSTESKKDSSKRMQKRERSVVEFL